MLKIKSVKPLFTGVVTTGEKYKEDMYDEHGLIECRKGDLKTYQKVLAVGSMVRDIEVGDTVMINVMNYAIKKYDANSIQNDLDRNQIIEYRFNWVGIEDDNGNHQECLLLNDRDLLFAFEGEEVQGVKNPIIVDQKKIITN